MHYRCGEKKIYEFHFSIHSTSYEERKKKFPIENVKKSKRNPKRFHFLASPWCAWNANLTTYLSHSLLDGCSTTARIPGWPSWHFSGNSRHFRQTIAKYFHSDTHAQLLCFPKTNWAGKVNRKKSVQKPVLLYISNTSTHRQTPSAQLLHKCCWKEQKALGIPADRLTITRRSRPTRSSHLDDFVAQSNR